MSDGKWFTVYWTNGVKSHVYGPTISDALKDAGSNDDSEIAWIDSDKITNSHYYDKNEKRWIAYKLMKITKQKFETLTLSDLLDIMRLNNILVVTRSNRSLATLKIKWVCFPTDHGTSGWVEYVEVFDSKFCSFDEDDEDSENGYTSSCCQYFAPVDLPHAFVFFAERVHDKKGGSAVAKYLSSIEEIYYKQEITFEV